MVVNETLIARLASANVKICKSIYVEWYYHLCPADDDTGTNSLCKNESTKCEMKIESWGHKQSYTPSYYCLTCATLAMKLGD